MPGAGGLQMADPNNWWEADALASQQQGGQSSSDAWWQNDALASQKSSPNMGFATRDQRETMEEPGVVEDVAKTIPSSLARGAAGVAGIPGVIQSGADWLAGQSAGRVENLLKGKGFVAPTAEERAKRAKEVEDDRRKHSMFYIPGAGDVMTPENVQAAIEAATGPLYKPKTDAGRYTGAVVEMAPGMIMGGGTALERILSTVGSGVGSEGLFDLTKGTWFEPYAKPVGAIAGGITGAVAPAAAERGVARVKDAAKSVTAPFREQGRRDLAARELLDRAENPIAFRAALQEPDTMYPGAKVGEMVPGSVPTTFQRTGDMGIGALEREVATANPTDFMTRRAEQNAARVGALDAVQPTGSAADVSSLLRQQLQHIDDGTQAIVDRIGTQARRAADAIPSPAADDVGEAMRTALAARNSALKAQERKLWSAVDPDGSLALDVSPLRTTARSIEGGVSPSARPIAGEERAIIDVINSYDRVLPFRELTDLRSRISAAMKEERRAVGESPTLARLTQLRGALENTIDTAVQRRVAQEAEAVATGAMRAEDTIEARLRAETQQWRDARAAATGTNAGAGDLGPASRGPSAVPRDAGAEVPGAGRPGDAPGGPGLPGQPVATPIDEAAAERLRAASAATRERKGTFNQGPVGETLKTTGMAGDYRSLDSAVPSKFFRAGAEGAERANLYRQAVGDTARADADLAQAAASSLRQSRVIRPDGTVDPARFAAWQQQHAPALNAVPGLRNQFATAARASEAMATAATLRREALDAAQTGVIGKLIGVSDPQDVVKTVGGLFGRQNGVQEMRDLAARARATPDGIAGLRKAVAEHINAKLMTNAEAATSGTNLISANAFQNFVKQNRDTLRQVFTPQEVEMMGRIAEDITRANRSVTAIKLPGGSNTPQDLMAQAAKGGESLLSRILRMKQAESAGAGAAAGWLLGSPFGVAPLGAAAGAGAGWMNSARQAGMRRVQDIVKEALLDPTLARTLLKEAPAKMDRGPWLELGRQLGRLGIYGAEGAASERVERKTGGRVEPTEAQKEAGNYRMHHVVFQGLPISIETRKGQVRSGVDDNGKSWSVKMPAEYGYLKQTEGADGDHVDVYVGPEKSAPTVWVIDQVELGSRRFDEHKCMLGFKSRGHAEQTYRAGFSDGKGGKRIGAITAMSVPEFKEWLKDGGTDRPAATGSSSS